MPEKEPKQEKKRNIDDIVLNLGERFERRSKQAHQKHDGSSETPRTEGTTEEPREGGGARTEPQTRERTPGGYSAKEKIGALVEGRDSRGAFAILMELLKQPPNQEGWLGLYPEGGDGVKKEAHKALLREIKYYIQGSDYERVKTKTDQGKPTPWRTNTNWNKADKTGREGKPLMRFWRHEGKYRTAWRDLRKWAQENHVWDEKKDKPEFLKETGGKESDRSLNKTARNIGTSMAVGGLYGAIAGPWKGFELALKHLLPYFLEDRETTQKMMEAMFGKEREKAGKGTKKEQLDRAKEDKTRKDVKEMTKKYVIESKDEMDSRDDSVHEAKVKAKLESLRESDEYKKASEEKRNELEKETEKEIKKRNTYHEVWRDMRIDWVKEEIWNETDENEFREEMGYDSKEYKSIYEQDFLTEAEWKTLKDDRVILNKKEATVLNTNTKPETRKNLNDIEIPDLKKGIEKLENRAELRFSAPTWPPYYKEKGRSRRSRQQESGIDTDDDDE